MGEIRTLNVEKTLDRLLLNFSVKENWRKREKRREKAREGRKEERRRERKKERKKNCLLK